MGLLILIIIVLGPAAFLWGIMALLTSKNEERAEDAQTQRTIGSVVLILGTGVMGVIAMFFLWLSSQNLSKGRVLRIDNRARLARRALGSGWADEARPNLAGLPTVQRAALGESWLISARMEHASVPAFSRLSLKLASLGAPAELLEACHLAALDEIRHARRCFALARAYSGLPWTAGALPELDRAHNPTGGAETQSEPKRPWDRLVRGSLLDGCLAEGVASLVAQEGARRATDPVVQETLEVISEDEGRHAELGWDVLDFALSRGGRGARAALRQALIELDSRQSPKLPAIPGVDEDFLARNGVLPQDELGRLTTLCIEQTRTRAEALLSAPARRPAVSVTPSELRQAG